MIFSTLNKVAQVTGTLGMTHRLLRLGKLLDSVMELLVEYKPVTNDND